jgi:hypothetical protein
VTPAPDALTVLIDALDGFVGALETGRADAVLAAEELLAAAVSAICTADLTLISRNPQTRGRLEEARQKLSRCRAMGATALGLTAIMGTPTYSPRRISSAAVASGATLETRA